MSNETCPYRDLEDEAFWRRVVTDLPGYEVSPFMARDAFELSPEQVVSTAGSCFAQNLARYLKASGYNYLVAEQAPAFLPAELHNEYNYGVFTARYCNIYTARQLRQLFDRAYGRFVPVETAWRDGHECFDPFRPMVQPRGYISEAEMLTDRAIHMAAVRKMFETSDVFIFTLGLTEGWVDKRDGAVYPVCPGCGVGTFDESLYEFKNFTVSETIADMEVFLTRLWKVNPKVKVILTVSPVPLIATMSGRHVLTATTYSKSVLRVTAEELSRKYDAVTYFPAYEIITAASSAPGRYFESDLRNVTEEGVKHVMRVFFKNFTGSVPRKMAPSAETVALFKGKAVTRTVKAAKVAAVSPCTGGDDGVAAADLICEEALSLGEV